MTTNVAQAYEELAYPGVSLPQMHPSQLAAVAALFDLHAAPVESCRVLELGCGNGSSLIPMAFELPESRFLGVDITAAAIEEASATADALGLRNIEFRRMDILEADARLGQFDYILSHGVFAWVPDAVREKLLALCCGLLARHGVAYVSYNTRPGGDLRMMWRDMMLYHIPSEGPPLERMRQARALVQMIAEAKGGNEFYQQLAQWQRERIERLSDALLFHDDLAPAHRPFYFHEFMERAEQHGLQYLGEADFFSMSDLRLPAAVREKLAQIPSIVAREQYMDFLTGRTFRQTLLCHSEVKLDRAVQPERLESLCFASPAEPVSPQPSLASDAAEEFHVGENVSVKTPHPLAKAMFVTLGEAWPADVRFEELRARVAKLVGETASRELAEGLLNIIATRPVIVFGTRPHACANVVSERPRLNPIARLQLEAGRPSVTSLRHFSVEARDPLFRTVLSLLDGARDRAAIVEALAEAVESGRVAAPPVGAGGDSRPLRVQIAEGLQRNLRDIARMGLLIA